MPEHPQELCRSEYKPFLEKAFSFWNHLSPSEQALILEKMQILKYPKGALVHSAGNDCLGILLIKSGELRVYMVSEEGREITLYRLGEGDVCVLSASCVLSTITFDVYIDAEVDTVLFQMPSKVFSRSFRKEYLCGVFWLSNISPTFLRCHVGYATNSFYEF